MPVEATLTVVPASTRNQAKARDPEMKPPRKGQPWYLGLQGSLDTDHHIRRRHDAVTTVANVHDSQMTPALLRGGKPASLAPTPEGTEPDHGPS